MTTSTGRFTEEWVEVGGTRLLIRRGGSGPPLLVLHGIEGDEGVLAFHEALADRSSVYAPSHPGYGYTECPEWISTIQHQAVFYHWLLQEAGLDSVDLVGVDAGGWIAAEMAVMSSAPIRRLVLVGAAGVKPIEGEIADVFVLTWPEVITRSFHDPDGSAEYQRLYASGAAAEFGGVHEAGKTMSMRLCFKPFMYDPALPGMLGKIRVPTLVVWGDDDRIIPLECGRMYQRGIRGAELRILDRCGHWAHLDQPQALADVVAEFVER